MYKALTIAGLDTGGGAGIIADIKTFSSLGVWGMAVITSVTAQNTVGVYGIEDVSIEMIRSQIRAVIEDIGVDAAKTGMLHTGAIVRTVAEEALDYGLPLVVDPVMVAKSGASLMGSDARDVLVGKLIPIAHIVTPNIPEAEVITGRKISTIDDMEKAAAYIVEELGCNAAVVKGGHLSSEEPIDVLYYNGKYWHFKAPRILTKNTHGTGCTYSAAITAEIAKRKSIPEAVELAKKFTYLAIMYGIDLGHGNGPVNHMAWLFRQANKYEVIEEIKHALKTIDSNEKYSILVPEVGMNIALANKFALDKHDVAAIPGRIRRMNNRAQACGCPEFGASKHLASYIMTARQYNKKIRAAVNIKYSEDFLKKLSELGLTISFYDRTEEPGEIKDKEGMTIPWGTKVAIERVGKVPDVIYHKGDIGKEPMIVILGEDLFRILKVLDKIVD